MLRIDSIVRRRQRHPPNRSNMTARPKLLRFAPSPMSEKHNIFAGLAKKDCIPSINR
ncbi:hypothetical protein CBM2609_B140057 [Cupriavidus taiwanensis]|nr:hypothetical protein CBM2604_B150058 [Cupriavidus taiwanensis]SOZ31999.1 hypothetical protein CBM2609_B140057 [Cupriavidus taiwanensis]SOZ47679.1 hypothetical protein CBM2610_B120057 [Cupriavidus taiwanensis]